MVDRSPWVGLGYTIPVNPSKIRVYIWRKLKEFGAEYFKPGVAILPNEKRNIEKFSQLAEKIQEMGGQASLVTIGFLDPRDEEEMIERFRSQAESAYQELLSDYESNFSEGALAEESEEASEDQIKRLLKRYNKIKEIDYFKSSRAGEADQMVQGLMDYASSLGSGLLKWVEKTLDQNKDRE